MFQEKTSEKQPSIKPIPTFYDGIKYRSRVEARWAVFFKQMGWSSTYEPEGFDLHSTWYLPDFWISDYQTYVEIKSAIPDDGELEKCMLLATETDKSVWLISGSPNDHRVWTFPKGWNPTTKHFAECRRCLKTVFYKCDENWNYCWCTLEGKECCGSDQQPELSGQVEKAMQAAMNERFGVHP